MYRLKLDTTLSWNINTHEILVCKIHDVDPEILNKINNVMKFKYMWHGYFNN
jgi:hypothetical protein